MLTIRTVDIEKVEKKLQMVAARQKDMSPVMAGVASRMLVDVKEHFKDEKDDRGKKWARWRDPKDKGGSSRVNFRPYKPGGNRMLQMSGGGLKNSIRHKSSRKSAMVFTNKTYAEYHQEGTKKMVQRKFMYLSRVGVQKIMAKLIKWSVGK